MPKGRGLIGRLWDWIYERSGLDHLPFFRVPYSYMKLEFWLGALVASSFMLLVITGLLLLFYYNPADPVGSNKALIEEKPFGRLLLTTHLYAAHAMILSAIIHFFRNFLVGAYKKPRELVWIVGIITGLIMIQTAFFGYSMVGDKIAQEAVAIGSGLVADSFGTYWGKVLVALAFGIEEETRYFRLLAIHIIMAGLLGLLFALHFGLFEQHGPQPDHRETRWRRRPEKISQDRKDLAPWFPVNLLYILVVTLGIWGIIILANAVSQAAGFVHQLLYPLPIFEDSPIAEKARPMPPWFLVYAFKIFQLDFLYLPYEGHAALLIFILAMVLPPLILAIFPFVDKSEYTNPLHRPWITIVGGLVLIYLIQLTIWGALSIGYSSLYSVAIIFLLPAIIVIEGVLIMSNVVKGRKITPLQFGLLMAVILIGFIAPFLPVLLGESTEASWADAATAIIGVAGAIAYLGILGALMPEESESTAVGSSPTASTSNRGSSEERGDPSLFFMITGILEFALIVFSGVFLGLVIDPIANPAGATALWALVFLGGYGLVHILYRVLTLDKIPYKGPSEAIPHLLVLIAFLIALPIII
ncbi:MAG: cytochrome b N-terminal domain-containing protein [Desulfurococcales archaeon]|nr:cytochrome b N-terminal domain-containing protein [Desulfurococcales archaeon]